MQMQSIREKGEINTVNPLSVDVLCVSLVSEFACSSCRASHRQNHHERFFERGEQWYIKLSI